MENTKKIIIGTLIGLGVAYSAFIVWYSVQVFKQSRATAQASAQAVQYINAGISAGLLPTIEQISGKLNQK